MHRRQLIARCGDPEWPSAGGQMRPEGCPSALLCGRPHHRIYGLLCGLRRTRGADQRISGRVQPGLRNGRFFDLLYQHPRHYSNYADRGQRQTEQGKQLHQHRFTGNDPHRIGTGWRDPGGFRQQRPAGFLLLGLYGHCHISVVQPTSQRVVIRCYSSEEANFPSVRIVEQNGRLCSIIILKKHPLLSKLFVFGLHRVFRSISLHNILCFYSIGFCFNLPRQCYTLCTRYNEPNFKLQTRGGRDMADDVQTSRTMITIVNSSS